MVAYAVAGTILASRRPANPVGWFLLTIGLVTGLRGLAGEYAGLVVGVYLGCVALLTRVLPVRGSVGVAVSVLAAAALFNPLRRRVQAVVDRRFDRARYDAERVVGQFSVQLRDQVDIDVLGEGLLGVVDQVLAPAHLSLWLREPGSFG